MLEVKLEIECRLFHELVSDANFCAFVSNSEGASNADCDLNQKSVGLRVRSKAESDRAIWEWPWKSP